LTIQVLPNAGLNWDLGDDNSLDEIAVRAPSAPFVKAILAKTGPLATASVAKSGAAPILDSKEVPLDGIELFFNNGKIRKTLPSTILRTIAGVHKVLREGAVDL
jgi:tRNA A37 threonylcarbamoyladenosine synthetase subunit TsaC/SUA5/YrdC